MTTAAARWLGPSAASLARPPARSGPSTSGLVLIPGRRAIIGAMSPLARDANWLASNAPLLASPGPLVGPLASCATVRWAQQESMARPRRAFSKARVLNCQAGAKQRSCSGRLADRCELASERPGGRARHNGATGES